MKPVTLQERVHSSQPPEEWGLSKLHHVFTVRSKNKNTGMQEDNLLSLSYGHIKRKDIAGADGLLPESFETYQIVEPGDVVLRLTDLQNDKRSLRQGLVTERGIITSAYDAVRVGTEHEPRFWFYALYALDLAKYYYSMGGGVRQSIKFSDFPNDWIAAPDLPTQKAIAAFLDRETARIDQLIEKKQRLVELLGERRRALLSDMVTGAFTHPDSLKPTGSVFVPHLPTHWRLAKLKQIARVRGGITVGRKVPEGSATLTVPYLRVANVQASYLDLSDVATLEVTESEKARYALKLGDVLMIEGGDNDKLGRGAVWSGQLQGAINQNHVFAMRPKDRRLSLWISMCSNAQFGRDYFFLNSRQSTNLASVSKTRAERMPIPLPPIDEVNSTVDLWISLERSLANTVDKTSTSIHRLKEYRSALITAAVTGQINVETWGRRGEVDRQLDVIEGGVPQSHPKKRAPEPSLPILVAAEIVDRHRQTPRFGRVKLQKLTYLAEAHLGIKEIEGQYIRRQMGPLDENLINTLERGMKHAGFFETIQDGGGQAVTYSALSNHPSHREALKNKLGQKYEALQKLISLFKDSTTEFTEIVATLFAVWNDALIDGKTPSDQDIIRMFYEDWHPDKKHFKRDQLVTALNWMRRHKLIPEGKLPRTISDRLFA